jgi:hypothetical protein
MHTNSPLVQALRPRRVPGTRIAAAPPAIGQVSARTPGLFSSIGSKNTQKNVDFQPLAVKMDKISRIPVCRPGIADTLPCFSDVWVSGMNEGDDVVE